MVGADGGLTLAREALSLYRPRFASIPLSTEGRFVFSPHKQRSIHPARFKRFSKFSHSPRCARMSIFHSLPWFGTEKCSSS